VAEEITLPNSGIVLTSDPGVLGFLVGQVGPIRVKIIAPLPQFEIKWRTWIGDHFDGDLPSLETAVACLDARVLELRAALLPHDTLARALWATGLRDRYGESDSWDELPTCKKDAAVAVAHSLLAALGGQP